MYIVIVGGGKVGYYLAKELVEANHEVLVIEEDPARGAEIAEMLGEIVMRGLVAPPERPGLHTARFDLVQRLGERLVELGVPAFEGRVRVEGPRNAPAASMRNS